MKSTIGCSTPMNRRLFLFFSLPPPLCIQDAGVCKACTRFSVSPRINRIRRIVGTYNEASSRLLSNFCITSKREFPASFFAASAPFNAEHVLFARGNTRCNRGVRPFLLRQFIRELFAMQVGFGFSAFLLRV